MMTCRFFLTVAAVVLYIVLYFFAAGIADGPVSSFNILLWLIVVTCLGSTVTGAGGLNAKGQRRTATTLPSVLAVPGILAAIFILSVIVFQPRWNWHFHRRGFRPVPCGFQFSSSMKGLPGN